MNIKKLVEWNMRQPYHKRIELSELQERGEYASVIGDNAALFAQIHGEIDGIIVKQVEALESL